MNKLITKSLQDSNPSLLLQIPVKLFNEFELKQINWIKDYMASFNTCPSIERFEKEFPIFIRVDSSDPLEDIFNSECVRRKNLFFIDQVTRHQKEINNGLDPSSLIEELNNIFSFSKNEIISTRGIGRVQTYFEKKRVFPFGVGLIDKSTGGVAFGDYVLIVGRPGSGKTTFMDWFATQNMLCSMRILYISNENPSDETIAKIDAFSYGFNPIKLRTGEWEEHDKERIFAGEFIFGNLNGEIIIPFSPALTVPEVIAYVDTFRPDLICIDGIYLMNTSGNSSSIGWEEVAGVSRGLKRFARKAGIPIIGTIQANRNAEDELVTRKTIASTDAFLQDADTVISLNRQGTKTIGQVIKSRWGETPLNKSFEIKVNYNMMMISVNNEQELEVIAEDDW